MDMWAHPEVELTDSLWKELKRACKNLFFEQEEFVVNNFWVCNIRLVHRCSSVDFVHERLQQGF